MIPECSRPIRIDTIGEGERTIEIEANAEERRKLAARFALVAIERLSARFVVHREGDAIVTTGTVGAEVTQACSITGDPLAATVEESVALRFVDEIVGTEDEIEIDDDVLDTLPIEDGAIDLGEAAAETMALALDPFPRGPGGEAALRAAGVIGEDEVGAFNAFAGLKAKLGQ